MARVQLNLNGIGEGVIVVDGHDISRAVSAVTVRSSSDRGRVEVELDLLAHEVTTVDSENATIVIPDRTREALTALGWTPPESVAQSR